MDRSVGRILKTLEELGLADNTIVVFTSDHGDMMGSHRLLAKTFMYEECTRVPMMIRTPGQTESRRVTGPVSQIDVVPTLLDLCDAEIPDHLQGRSLRPWLQDRDAMEDDVFMEWSGPNAMPRAIAKDDAPLPDCLAGLGSREELREGFLDPARTIVTADGWKFVCSPLGQHQLYHLAEDPGETQNLAGDPEQRDRMRELRERIVAWQERTGDTEELPEL